MPGLVLALLLAPSIAGAQASPCDARPDGGGHVVDVTLWSRDADARRLESVLEELLSRHAVTVCPEPPTRRSGRALLDPPPHPAPALARVQVELRQKRAVVWIVDGPWARVLRRSVPLVTGVDEVAREQIGHIVYGTTEALLAGRRIGVEREQMRRQLLASARRPAPKPAPSRAPPSTAAPPPPRAIELEAGYALRARGTATPLAHEAHLGVRALWPRAGLRPFVGLDFGYRFDARIAASPVEVHIGALLGRAEVGLDVPAGAHASVRFGAGGGVDLLLVSPSNVAGTGVTAAPASRTWQPRLVVSLDARIAVSPRVGLDVGADVQIDPVDERYVIDEQTGRSVVVDPWRIAPGLRVLLLAAP